MLRHAVNRYGGDERASKQSRGGLGVYKMGSSLGGAMGIAVTASLYALLLPLGMASAAQYALHFHSAMCLASVGVTWALLPSGRAPR